MSARGRGTYDELCSNDEMDRRIAALAARAGIARGEMLVRQVAPRTSGDVHAAAADAVLVELAKGRPAAISFLAYLTGLPRSRVAAAVKRLADEGKIVQAGGRRNARARVERMWEIAQ